MSESEPECTGRERELETDFVVPMLLGKGVCRRLPGPVLAILTRLLGSWASILPKPARESEWPLISLN